MAIRPPLTSVIALAAASVSAPMLAGQVTPGLLFHAPLDSTLTAEVAHGEAAPNFRANVDIVPDGAIGGAARWADDGYVAWRAPGNMRAARGTLSFFWRAREPLGEAPFVIFRAGFADHTSWDMAFLRIDWNGHGFDAFVTDANLSRVRLSWRMDRIPDAEAWTHLAFAWDETKGVVLHVDGREVARKVQAADLDSGLDQFGLAGRVMAPHQVQSRYNFMRGSDVDDIRVYDRILSPDNIARLAARAEPGPLPPLPATRTAWLHRYGWDKGLPPLLDTPVTRVRKIEFADAKDLKEDMWKGVDGIRETTWPGVYNRSRLPGRDDYFELPDWNVYVEGGKRYDLTVPAGEQFNRVELRGAAYGALSWSDGGTEISLAQRPQGAVRTVHRFAPRTGGVLHFTNIMREQPIQELWAYDIGPGTEPAGSFKLDYTVRAGIAPTLAALAQLNAFIAGRHAPDERATVVAMPTAGVKAAVGAAAAGGAGKVERPQGLAPIVHILIPASLGDALPDQPVARAFDYGWQNGHDGLDGIAIDLPALAGSGPVALNIRVKDPIWPERDLIDLSVTMPPGEKRTLWLDLRDRILSHDSLYLSIAASDPAFSATSLDGSRIRLVFKPRAEALREHVADRLRQVKDNWAFLVEEHTSSKRMALYRRLFADATDLLRIDPDNGLARAYWADIDYRPENFPAFVQPTPQAGEPLWAFRQLEDLGYVRRFVDWWIDHRQVPYGDFGGGISDDTDLIQQWPGLRALTEAVQSNGMKVNGLGYIATDELHAYEEGLNSDAARLYLNWGEPRSIERLMETTRALQGVILKNAAGHMHFASSWYGGRRMYRDPPWAWQKPYAFTVMHAPILVGLYNGNAQARGLVTGVMDGWLAHGVRGKDGFWRYPNEINWWTDAERTGDGGGISTPLQSAWSAWRFTGDPKYLHPIESRIAGNGAASLTEFNENGFEALPGGARLRADLAGNGKDDPFSLYTRWLNSGDTEPLDRLHADAIADKANHEYLYTQGHWWSDRVEQQSDILQRERLGGIALRRNQTWPGNSVSWRFDEPGAAEQVAILIPGATRDRFKVIAYNRTDRPQHAMMTAWNVTAGEWTMRRATGDGDRRVLAGEAAPTALILERSLGTRVVFAPHMTTVYDFALAKPSTPVEQRADLGIGMDDVVRTADGLAVTVHSLGAQPTTGGTLTVLDQDGAVVAVAPIPPLAAPADLHPRTVTVRIKVAQRRAARVEIGLPGNAAEVTRQNNAVTLSSAP